MDDQRKLTPEQDLKIKQFLAENKERIENWYKTHKQGYTIPFYWDATREEFIWANRKMRRAK